MTGVCARAGRDGGRFDEAVGLGDIEAVRLATRRGRRGRAAGGGAGSRRFPFHCTQIADGSRTVAVGARVSFGLLAGRAGRWEAADIAAPADVSTGRRPAQYGRQSNSLAVVTDF